MKRFAISLLLGILSAFLLTMFYAWSDGLPIGYLAESYKLLVTRDPAWIFPPIFIVAICTLVIGACYPGRH